MSSIVYNPFTDNLDYRGNTGGSGNPSSQQLIIRGPEIDFTTTGVTNIFAFSQQFLVTGIYLTATAVTGSPNADFQFNLGWTAPDYDDIVNGYLSPGGPSLVNYETGTPVGVTITDFSSIPAGQTLAINITTAESVATVYTLRLDVAGYYFDGSTIPPVTNAPRVTVFTSNGNWTKSLNPPTRYMSVYGVGGGGGGASGRKGTSNASSGGGGGAGGSSFFFEGVASLFPSSAAVVVGAGGAGGAAQTVDANNGNPGVIGGVTSFGTTLTTGATTAAAGGTNVDSSGGVGQLGTFTYFTGLRPTGQTGTTSNAPNIARDLSSYLSGSGGGGGSGAHATLQRLAAPAYNFVKGDATSLLAGGLAGVATGDPNGGNGNVPLVSPEGIIMAGTGGGGGAGTFVATLAGNGGNGAIPGGGGGGGGGGISALTNSGAGGNGARGQLTVIEYF